MKRTATTNGGLRGRTLARTLLLASALFAVFAAPAHAGKVVDSFVGGTNDGVGGHFTFPHDLAFDATAGALYVSDSSGAGIDNHRIQRLDAFGGFQWAFGWDVVSTDSQTVFEKCVVALNCKPGVAGTARGQFDDTSGVAVDPNDGSIYVHDRDNRRIQKFNSSGQFLLMFGKAVNQTSGGDVCPRVGFPDDVCKIGTAGSAAGQLSSSTSFTSLVVNPTGNVYVPDPGNRRVMEFQSDGTFVRAWGWGVDSGTGAFELCTTATTCQGGLTTSGADNGRFGTSQPLHLAVDPAGTVYATDSNTGNRIMRFNASVAGDDEPAAASLLGTPILSTTDAGPLLVASTSGLEVDPTDGHLYAIRDPSSGETVVQELNTPTAAPAVADTHAVGAGFGSLNGIAIDGAGGKLFVSIGNTTVGGQAGQHGVFVLDDDGPASPTATPSPASDVGATTATLQGVVDPNGGLANYRFEVSTDGIAWTSVGTTATVTGGDPVAVAQGVTGLEANRLYRVRIVVTKVTGLATTMSSTSSELTLLTDAVAPTVTTLPQATVSDTEATLRGRVNANNQPSTYRFEYGTTTSYGSSVPIPDSDAGAGGLERAVSEHVDGLLSGVTYHYRLVATNPRGTSFGADRAFTTREAVEPPPGRGYEMVTPARKSSRITGHYEDREGLPVANPGVPSIDGDSLMFSLLNGIVDGDPDSGTQFPEEKDDLLLRRAAGGWHGSAVQDIAGANGAVLPTMTAVAASGDFEVEAYKHDASQFPSKSRLSTKVFGSTSGVGGTSWYDWLVDPVLIATPTYNEADSAIIDDAGARMVRWGNYRGLLGPGDSSAGQVAGRAMYYQDPPGSGARVLVNECTGTGGNATVIPERDDNDTPSGLASVFGTGTSTVGSNQLTAVTGGPFQVGHAIDSTIVVGTAFPAGTRVVSVGSGTLTLSANATASLSGPFGAGGAAQVADDTIATRSCEDGSVTSVRGAAIGSQVTPLNSSPTTALSNDGSRTFFMSPDPQGGPDASCADADDPTGAATNCPPQLYVRQLDSSGDPTVRWISRPTFPGQAIGLFGRGAAFEGASSDGRVVYFRTNAPLVANDPNGTGTPGPKLTGSASDNSWDLYRYELPASADADPATGALTRISAGPSGNADPNTNCTTNTGEVCAGASPGANGAGGAVRYVSEDGTRVYFVTNAPIPGAIDSPPTGGTTSPAGSATTNTGARNLYLYDDNETGAARWRFVARLPFSQTGSVAASCATYATNPANTRSFVTTSYELGWTGANCVRGNASGTAIAFLTEGALTEDDDDAAIDVYRFDAVAGGRIERISAPPSDTSPYPCGDGQLCNGDFGFTNASGWGGNVGLDGARHWNVGEDGGVYFESRVALVANDTNGSHYDTYAWREGDLSLISPGNTLDHAFYSGNSADGDDVFFWTSQRIDPREIEDADFDVYDARVGGGFPPPPPTPPDDGGCSVSDDACQGAGSGRLDVDESTAARGGGNLEPSSRPLITVASLGRRARLRAARSGVVRLRLRTATSGRVKAVARAPLARRARKRAIVAVTTVATRADAPRTVVLRLNAAARRTLRAGFRLRVVVTLRQPGARPVSMAFVLRGGVR